jgi:hypothetical protein
MLRAGMPAEWSQGERLVALIIADACSDRTGTGYIANEQLCTETGYTQKSLSDVLRRLSRHGYEMRVPHGLGKDGRPVFAARGHGTDYRVPILKPRSTPDLSLATPVDNLPERPGPHRAFAEKGPVLTAKGPVLTGDRSGPHRTPTPVHLTNPKNLGLAVITPPVEDSPANGHGSATRQPNGYQAKHASANLKRAAQ